MEHLNNTSTIKTVGVAMGVYNGEKFLREQLDSLINQKGVNLYILARDDGSIDNSAEILKEYEKSGKIHLLSDSNKNLGFAKNFVTLLQNMPRSDYYAFCDQDDVWDEDKLEIAVSRLNELPSHIPILYHSAVLPVTQDLKKVLGTDSHSKYNPDSPTPFIDCFKMNFTYGCTCVFNNRARELLLKMDPDELYTHDWTLNMICTGMGKTVFDPIPHFKYRQHKNNSVGFYKGSFSALIRTLKIFFKNELKNARSKEAKKFKKYFYNELSPENREFLDLICDYKNSHKNKKALLKCDKYKSNVKSIRFYNRFLIRVGKL